MYYYTYCTIQIINNTKHAMTLKYLQEIHTSRNNTHVHSHKQQMKMLHYLKLK